MKAAQINEYGDPSVVKIQEVEKPALKAGQVLVEVHASSLNPFDTMVRAGNVKDYIHLELPSTLGGDIAGVIVELGEGVRNFAVGDAVFGQAGTAGGDSGAWAEYAATIANHVAKAPSNLDFKQAASLPLVSVSALQGLTEHINLQPGQKIFIHGGSGGIGSIAIQIAKSLGAHVATTATGEHIGMVKKLGADEVIDYKAQDFAEVLHGYDAVFDTVGGEDFIKALNVLKPGGVAVSMIATADEAKAKALGVTAFTQATKVTTEALDKVRELVEAGKITPQIGKVFPLDEIQAAFTARETGSVAGKIVIAIKA